ncbi:MAG: hypothetical protein ABIQ27_10505 [Flavobacterium sp.]|uniref:DUF7010 family protein n=1 Tax=Flavobacterium sp. TaxID=239 RepID=UPI00326433D3
MKNNSSNNQVDKIETTIQAQADMCIGYGNGSIGIMVSGLAWLTSAIVSLQFSDRKAIWTLLIGGMFIHHLSILWYKAIGMRGTHEKGNPLANLAMEGTLFMIMCLPLAFGLSLQHSEWFFQAMLMIIGGRYLTFASIYGKRLYWFLGAVLGIAAYLLFYFKVQSFGSALTGSLIEITFGLFMLITFRRNNLKHKV